MKASWIRNCTFVAALASSACTHSDLRPDYVREPSMTISAQANDPLAAYATRLSAGHGKDSGLRLLNDSVDALLARIALADRATRSIDVQYYLFHSDSTGQLVAEHLLAAADRGVRVRVLLDDLHKIGKDDVLRALDGHPHIEIRLFNPFHERKSSLWSMGKQFAGDFSRLNRRMHNKAFIADGALAIVGGRNIGDEYFDASGLSNFRDLDVLTIGPVVAEISQMFDSFWNSAPAVPIAAFRHDPTDATELASIRASLAKNAREIGQTPYAENVVTRAGDLKREEGPDHWAWGEAAFLTDDPGKVDPELDRRDLHLAPRIKEWLDGAKHRILLISPYFVPGDKGVAYLAQKRAEGIEVAVLTNSLASTDAGNVYAAYASYRPKLLAAGVELYELKPDAAHAYEDRRSLGSSSSSLHAKAIVVDDNRAFIGSMNLDPRSGNYNTEDGVIVTSVAVAKALSDLFALATTPAVTYRVRLKEGTKSVYWETTENGETVLYDKAPRTSAWRRAKAGMTRALPIEGLL
jgi:putative cardiolipin synthase